MCASRITFTFPGGTRIIEETPLKNATSARIPLPWILLLLVLAGLFLLQGVLCLNNLILYSPDSVNYLGWAQSLSTGKGFSIPFNAEPSSYVVQAPLYPVLLTPFAWLFRSPLFAAKAFSLVLALLVLILFFRFLYRETGGPVALLCALMLVLHPSFLLYSTQVLSEIPFVLSMFPAFAIAALTLGHERSGAKEIAALVLSLVVCQFLRDLGAVITVSVVIALLVRRRYREAGIVLLACGTISLAWELHNEAVAVSTQHSGLRNTVLFLSRAYTGPGSSLWTEGMARFSTNGLFYAQQSANLLFSSQYTGWSAAVVRPEAPVFALVRNAVGHAQAGIMAVTSAILLFGFFRLLKESAIGRLVVLFSALYLLVILLYPVLDPRFLFPLLFPFLLSFARSAKHVMDRARGLDGRGRFVLTGALGSFLTLLQIPNAVWAADYIGTSVAFRDDPVGLSTSTAGEDPRPSGFTRLLPQAADWITQHCDSSAVVLCQYKEIALWLDGRKVLNPDPGVSIAEFRFLLRDYHPLFVVNTLQDDHWGDFDFQMATSTASFLPVYRIGDTEVLKVVAGPAGQTPRAGSLRDSSADPERDLFIRAARLMNLRGKEHAEEALQNLAALHPADHMLVCYYAGVGAQLALHLNAASVLYRRLQTMPQAGAYVVRAGGMQELSRSLTLAGSEPSSSGKAEYLCVASAILWQSGFRGRARDFLEEALQLDPASYPALVQGIRSSFDENDLTAAQGYFRQARRIAPNGTAVVAWGNILSLLDTISISSESRLAACRLLSSIDLPEEAIDQLLLLLHDDPNNAAAMAMLAETYRGLGRLGPAEEAMHQR